MFAPANPNQKTKNRRERCQPKPIAGRAFTNSTRTPFSSQMWRSRWRTWALLETWLRSLVHLLFSCFGEGIGGDEDGGERGSDFDLMWNIESRG